MHFRSNFYHLDIFKFGGEILDFMTGIVGSIKTEQRFFEGLAAGYRFVKVGAGGVDFLGEPERRMDP
ncbi:hypothetical protein D3C85_1750550 [compost metagenome]